MVQEFETLIKRLVGFGQECLIDSNEALQRTHFDLFEAEINERSLGIVMLVGIVVVGEDRYILRPRGRRIRIEMAVIV